MYEMAAHRPAFKAFVRLLVFLYFGVMVYSGCFQEHFLIDVVVLYFGTISLNNLQSHLTHQ